MKLSNYGLSLKQYHDYINTVDYAKLEGKLEMIKNKKAAKEPMEKIIAYSGLSKEEIEELLEQHPQAFCGLIVRSTAIGNSIILTQFTS